MSGRRPARHDEGFTLVEMVIAMLIMAIAVVTIVGSLAAMMQLTAEHRGHAVVEVGTRSFGEAVQQQATFTTKLTAPASANTLSVTDTSLLPRVDGTDTYVYIDREVMRVTGMTATSLTVVRDINDDYTPSTRPVHGSGRVVVPILRCPTVTQLTPAAGTYEKVTGVTATITAVEYWDATTRAFEGRSGASGCESDFDTSCDNPDTGSPSTFVLPECGDGLFRATIAVTTPATGVDSDPRLRGVSTSTTVLLRTGSG